MGERTGQGEKAIRDVTDEGIAAIRPTPERLRHGPVDTPEPDRDNQTARPAHVRHQMILDRYKVRHVLDADQLIAAYRWHAVAMRSKRFPKATMSWQGPINGAGDNLHDGQVAAGIQRDAGIKYLSQFDTDFVSILDHVCVHDYAAENWARQRKLRLHKGMETLRLALDFLCRHYGLK